MELGSIAQTYEETLSSVPSLQRFCQISLSACRDYLGDIGDTPVWLLYPVLSLCTAQQLTTIEDETRAAGRDLSTETWYFWQRLYLREAKRLNPDATAADFEVPVLHGEALSPLLGTLPEDAVPGNWRWLFEDLQIQRHQQGVRAQQKMRDRLEEQAKLKQQHRTLLIRPQHRPRQRCNAGTPQEVSGVRSRLLKKLGLPTKARSLGSALPAGQALPKRTPLLQSKPTPMPACSPHSVPPHLSHNHKRTLRATDSEEQDMFSKKPKTTLTTPSFKAALAAPPLLRRGSFPAPSVHLPSVTRYQMQQEEETMFERPSRSLLQGTFGNQHPRTLGGSSGCSARPSMPTKASAASPQIHSSAKQTTKVATSHSTPQKIEAPRLSCTDEEFDWGVPARAVSSPSTVQLRPSSTVKTQQGVPTKTLAGQERKAESQHSQPITAGLAKPATHTPSMKSTGWHVSHGSPLDSITMKRTPGTSQMARE